MRKKEKSKKYQLDTKRSGSQRLESEKPKHLQKPDPIDMADFKKTCDSIGMELSETQSISLKHYLDTLMLWNTRINLVGKLEWKHTLTELIIDSHFLVDFMQALDLPQELETWDLGSGAGLPGIPLRCLWQEGDYYLVESREKRALFMTTFLLKEKLKNTEVFWGRAEKFFAQKKEKNIQADLIVSRAFMPYEELTEFVYPHLKKNGILLLMLNERTPKTDELWKITKSMEYEVKQASLGNIRQKRYFHAFMKNA